MALKILHHVSSLNWKITKQEEKRGEIEAEGKSR